MIGDFLADLAGLPLRVLSIPDKMIQEVAAKIDPNDDVAIRSAAEAMAKPMDLAIEVVEEGIRKALNEKKGK